MRRLSLRQSLALSTLGPMIVFSLVVLALSSAWAWHDVLDAAGKRNDSLTRVAAVALSAHAARGDLDAVCAALQDLSSLAPGHLYVADRNGTHLCPSTQDRPTNSSCTYDPNAFLAQEEITPSTQVQGRCLVSYAPIPATSWGVVLEEDRPDVVASARSFLVAIGALMIVGLLISFWLVWIGFQRASWPLLAVTEQARRVAAGQEFAPPDVSGPAEVEALVDAFNHMVTLLRKQRDTLQEYAAGTLNSQEEERKRISRDLHDETAQQLVGLIQRINLCCLMAEDNPKILAALDELAELAHLTLSGVRRMSRALRPLILEDLGLVAAVQAIADELDQELPGTQVFCEIIGEEERLLPEIELAAFRIVQEALTNIRKHASGADRVYVTIQFEAETIEIHVEDNGQGFYPPQGEPGPGGEHLGLLGMKERAELWDGTIAIRSRPGEGTEVTLILPKTAPPWRPEEHTVLPATMA